MIGNKLFLKWHERGFEVHRSISDVLITDEYDFKISLEDFIREILSSIDSLSQTISFLQCENEDLKLNIKKVDRMFLELERFKSIKCSKQ